MKRYYLKETVETFNENGLMMERRISETFEDEVQEITDKYPSPWWGITPPNNSGGQTVSSKEYKITLVPQCGTTSTDSNNTTTTTSTTSSILSTACGSDYKNYATTCDFGNKNYKIISLEDLEFPEVVRI